MRRLKSFDGVQGVVVYAPEKFEPPEWSPDMQCPSERIGMKRKIFCACLIDAHFSDFSFKVALDLKLNGG